jgi:transketolase
MVQNTAQNYQKTSQELRKDVLDMLYNTRSPHIGCCFSLLDILTVLYSKILLVDPKKPNNPGRDRFLLSKGHAVPALYAILAKKGFIDEKTLATFAKTGGILEQHPTRNIDYGIEITSGSLGHGLSLGAGMALAGKVDKKKYRVFVLTGDGELDEGSNWEAIMFAAHKKLDNLVAIVDRNRLQILGKTSEIMGLEPLAAKWRSFGWAVKEVDGHNHEELEKVFKEIPFAKDKPSVVIANTVKGKGVSFMENELRWHDKCPDENEYGKALEELKK